MTTPARPPPHGPRMWRPRRTTPSRTKVSGSPSASRSMPASTPEPTERLEIDMVEFHASAIAVREIEHLDLQARVVLVCGCTERLCRDGREVLTGCRVAQGRSGLWWIDRQVALEDGNERRADSAADQDLEDQVGQGDRRYIGAVLRAGAEVGGDDHIANSAEQSAQQEAGHHDESRLRKATHALVGGGQVGSPVGVAAGSLIRQR